MTTAQMNDPERDGSAAVGIPVDRTVRPHAWVHESGHLMLAESSSADDAQLLHRGWLPLSGRRDTFTGACR